MLKKFLLFIIVLMLLNFISSVNAGVGIKWERESVLVNEGQKPCLTYSVYNPWPEATYVKIELSEELKNVLIQQDMESKLIPENTASSAAIPVEFCFKVPKMYNEDCLLFNSLICKQECNEEQKMFAGEVLVKSVAGPAASGGSGGSATTMAVSAPLKIKVNCVASTYYNNKSNLTLLFLTLGIICLIIIIFILYKKRSSTRLARDEEMLKRLQERIKSEKSKIKKNK